MQYIVTVVVDDRAERNSSQVWSAIHDALENQLLGMDVVAVRVDTAEESPSITEQAAY